MIRKIFPAITMVSLMVQLVSFPDDILNAEELTKVAVMDLKAKSGIDQMTVSSLTDLVCTEIADLGKYEVIGRDDMATMLEHIADRQLLDCDDTQCLAQVGGALGVNQLVSGNVGMVGKTYLINMKLIDIENAKVINRISEKYTGDEAGLIEMMKRGILFCQGYIITN